MTTAWAHLPNATHIDRVLADLKQHPERWRAAWGAARDAAWGAVAALVAWDGCAHLLDQTPEFVQAHINLTNDPAAVLLLPAVIAFQGENHGIQI